MSSPQSYSPSTIFLTFQATQSWFPGPNLDVEFNNLKTSITQIIFNLNLIQRNDGALANGAVTFNSLSAPLQAFFASTVPPTVVPPVADATNLSWKSPVRVATVGSNITLSGLFALDGITLVANDRVLVKDQAVQTQNGIYVVAAGVWSRSQDANLNSQLAQGTSVLVTQGTANAFTEWVLTTTNPITIGSSNLTWGFKP